MSNTVFNLVEVRAPQPALDRFIKELQSVTPGRDPLDVHVRADDHASAGEAWGTRGSKYEWDIERLAAHAELRFATHWSTPYLWVEHVGAGRPELDLRLFCGCMESGFGGHIHVHDGRVVFSERIKEGFGEFFARCGRPGFFVPYWESDESALDEPTLEDVGAFRDAAHEAIDDLGPVELIGLASGEPEPRRIL